MTEHVYVTDALHETGIAKLGMTLISITGDDAKQFLHNQWSQHVLNVGFEARLACYCSPQGRILATPLYWEKDGVISVVLPTSLAETMVKRWRMFVLRSKVLMTITTTPVYGVLGDEALMTLGFTPFDKAGLKDNLVALRMPGVKAPLYVVVGQVEAPLIDEANFWLAAAKDGVVLVTGATSGEFVPQMLNLDRVGAVSFNKGCYPGQEVVARLQYVGQTNRRARLLMSTTPPTSDDVFEAGAAVGRVALSVTVGDVSFLVAVISTKANLDSVTLDEEGLKPLTVVSDYSFLPEPNIRA